MDKAVTKLILAFVALLIGIVLIGSISTEGQSRTTTRAVVDESHLLSMAGACPGGAVNISYVHTLTYAPTGWKTQDCPITSFVITNSSGTAFTETTDYVLTASAGTYTLKNTVAVNQSCGAGNNITLVDYRYCADDYMNSSWGRTAINLVPGFFAIALMIVSVGLFYSVAKDYNII